jgi:predicted enzyme related to lactoylglutathione lyase
MANSKSPFVWYELMSTDVKGGKDFYTKVVGWGTEEMQGMDYTLFKAADGSAGGVMVLPEQAKAMGVPTHWMGYIAVDDVDASAEKVKKLGGQIHVPPSDIPNVGRFSVAQDPQGASFALFKPAEMEGGSQPEPLDQMRSPGHVGWHELYAVDGGKALEFYQALFGWEKGDSMDMGPMGTYQIFNIGSQQVGGIMNKPAEMPVAAWCYYFNVGNIDDATGRVKANGGQVMNGPMEVPGGGWIVQGMDPQGGVFALFGSK